MNIAILHYHLKAGGVSAVIRQQRRVLQDACRVCVMVGEAGDAPVPADIRILPELAYSRTACNPEAAAEAVLAEMRTAFGGSCDVLHVHNPTLAKNVNLLKILESLQRRGLRLLLQINDFSEDGRPQVCSPEEYPRNCHYAAINSRDHRLLHLAGLKPEGLHLLPNMVEEPGSRIPRPEPQPLVLYPVRAIRRKNLGEAILLSLFFHPRDRLGVTLPPNSPADRTSYRSWQQFVRDHRLSVDFELGANRRFDDLVRSAKFIVTTSVSEGFGFSFLEPWLYGQSLQGRKLPAVCRDFENRGISLCHLYSRLRIPLAWFDYRLFFRKWSHRLRQAAQRFDAKISEKRIRTAFATLTAAGDLDFGLLDEAAQRGIIEGLLAHAGLRARLLAYNPFLGHFSQRTVSDKTIAANRQAVAEGFSADAYRRRLLEIYASVKRNRVAQGIDKSRLVSAFLHPSAFSLLRWDLQDE